MFILAKLITWVSLAAFTLAADSNPLNCTNLLDPVAPARTLVAELKAKTLGTIEVDPTGDGELLTFQLPNGSIVASNMYALPSRSTMIIDLITVEPAYRKQDLSRLLIAEAIVRHPEVTVIKALLSWSNAEAFFTAYYAQTIRTRIFHPSRANLAALEKTPFYRVLEPLGFSRVTLLEVRDENIAVSLERPPLQ